MCSSEEEHVGTAHLADWSFDRDLNRTTECDECRHHSSAITRSSMNGVTDPALQFRGIKNEPASRSSSDR
jgi:hypothetical protein